ncbi:unnamed protein product, partial [Rotaria sp. Silwood2]
YFLTHLINQLEIIEETIAGYAVLSHDTLHSQQIIKVQALIKHYDSYYL